jgi:hypothetical protein
VAVSGLLLLNGIALYLFIVDTQIEQTVGVLLAAFAALSLAVALEGLRHATPWAWNTMWVVVVSLTAIGAHTLSGDRVDVPLTYFFLAAMALAGQLLARAESSA